MKNIFKNIGLTLLTFTLITSCNEDDNTGESLVDYSPATVTLSSSSPTTFSESAIDEDDASTYTVEITATLPSAQPATAVIDLVQTGGTADSSDFSAGTITIPAGSLTGSATVEILQTGDIEGTETLEISGSSRANFIVSPFTYTISIEDDYINDGLELTLSWDGSAEDEDGNVAINSFCELDFDIILYDEAFNYLGYVLGTSNCPENDILSGLPDGTYYLVSDLWSNPYSSYGFTDTIPLTLTWSQEYFDDTAGSISTTAYNLSSEGSDTGANGLGGLIVVLEVSNGYEYTLSEF
ncbi:hypothetical protein [Neotamlana laminarinivorans]|uniref:Calx-beta domain-containing protein n=1 Tax=Neotamlana laminarinivorans TaxID=2883124 RepID=A0A9X1I0Z4_9FLAO|nr:hypothetical protein [Tamlana laminarinivorans]MCB4799236.1 hypothetical protein [Tamlana laminarinivorans]